MVKLEIKDDCIFFVKFDSTEKDLHICKMAIIHFLVILMVVFNESNCQNISVTDPTCKLSACSCCATTRCQNGTCLDGCIPGIHGRRCFNQCPVNCVTCVDYHNIAQTANCTTCKDSYYSTPTLYQCQSSCQTGCKTCASSDFCTACTNGYHLNQQGSCQKCQSTCSVCNPDHGCSSCIEGYHMETGSSSGYGNCKICPLYCLTCISESQCTQCNNSRFGERCQSLCSAGCENGCQINNGHCKCKEWFMGDMCDTCVTGRYGQDCSKSCSAYCQHPDCDAISGECDSCIGNHQQPKCESCTNGFYAQSCNLTCPMNCNRSICEQISGHCSFGCVGNFAGNTCDNCTVGKFGPNCTMDCPEHCEGSRCDRKTGNCYSCKPNFNGTICDKCINGKYHKNCSVSCPLNCSDAGCDRNKGECFSCFLNQTYGHKCGFNCSRNCKEGTCLPNNGSCDKGCNDLFTGNNCSECKPGKYGTDCKMNCSENCKNKTCDKITGDCSSCTNVNFELPKCETCVNNFFGIFCDLNCSKTCFEGSCEMENGTCTNGCIEYFSGMFCNECKTGMFGDQCNQDCPRMCSDNMCNMSNGNCFSCNDKFRGEKCDECDTGFFGQYCTKNCSSACSEKGCKRINGECLSCLNNKTYGSYCNLSCPINCKEQSCEQSTGNCDKGCRIGYSGNRCCLDTPFCERCSTENKCESCLEGKFGVTCEKKCPTNCADNLCLKSNGTCLNCRDGYFGSECHGLQKADGYNDNSKVASIVGSLVGAAVAVGVVVAIIVIWKRRFFIEKRYVKRIELNSNERIYENEEFVLSDQSPVVTRNTNMVNETSEPTRSNDAAVQQINKSASVDIKCDNTDYYNTGEVFQRKLLVSDLNHDVKNRKSDFFIEEFQQLPQGLLKPCTEARRPENLAKNRYNAIYPYDETRVKLDGAGSDFINACYVDGYRRKREYIASLGPILKATEEFRTFWRMVWQVKTEKIVMVTNLMERGGMKCEKYWPDVNIQLSYGDIIVTCHCEDIYAEYTLRKLTVAKGEEERPLYHIHYTAWPDKAVPGDVTSLIDFRQKVNSIKSSLNGPMIVHCSAGVGRTGTYIALDILTQEGETEGTVDVFGRVSSMRYQRTNMVQTWEQYEYLHHALVHTLTFDYRPIASEEFEEYVSTCSDAVMMANFEQLNSVAENIPESEIKAKQRNNLLQHLNRKNADIPGDIGRPRLFEGKTEGDNDYINAVYLNSYRQKDGYLLAMTPLPETITDFLTMLIQENVSSGVSLDDEHSQLQGIGIYIPADNQTLKLGPFAVKSCLVTSNSCYVQRSLAIIMRTWTGQKSRVIHHFQINHWPDGTAVPYDNAKFLQLICEAEKAANDTEENATMVVHCQNAAERSCLFCAISIMMQKMETEHEVSVVNTLRKVKSRRSLAIPNKEQYVFCHKCICTHLQSGDSNLYTNLAIRQ